MRNSSRRLWRWLLLAGGLAALLGLAAGLSTLDFRPTWIQPAGSLATSLDWWLFWARLLAIAGLLVTLAVLLIGVIARPAHLGPKPKMGSPLIAVLLTLLLIGLLDPDALKALLRLQPAPAATPSARRRWRQRGRRAIFLGEAQGQRHEENGPPGRPYFRQPCYASGRCA